MPLFGEVPRAMLNYGIVGGTGCCNSGFIFVRFLTFLGKQSLPSLHTLAYLHPTSHLGGQEMQAVPTNMSAMSTIRMLRANTGGDNAQPPLPPEPSYALGIGGMDAMG